MFRAFRTSRLGHGVDEREPSRRRRRGGENVRITADGRELPSVRAPTELARIGQARRELSTSALDFRSRIRSTARAREDVSGAAA